MTVLTRGSVRADLSEERDWLLSHSVCVSDVCLDDLGKRFFHSLQSRSTKHKHISEQTVLYGHYGFHVYCWKVIKNQVQFEMTKLKSTVSFSDT